MNVKLEVEGKFVYQKRLFRKRKAVGMISDVDVHLFEGFSKYLLRHNASVTIKYEHLARRQFRRVF